MKLTYFGHSFWLIETQGKRIVIDPFDDIGYPMPKDLFADCIIISHDHHDHNNTSIIKGNPQIIKTPGLHSLGSIIVTLMAVFHDEQAGKKRGINHLIKLQRDDFTLVHCGDLGHIPSSEVCSQIDKPDVLLIPVGEIYTLSVKDAWGFIDIINPKLIVPMHYNTSTLHFNLGSVDAFIGKAKNIIRFDSNSFTITEQLLAVQHIIIPNWKE